MSNRRSSREINFDILKAIRSGVTKPTRIMYHSNISWQPLQDRLAELAQKGYIVVDNLGDREHKRDRRRRKKVTITPLGEEVFQKMVTFFDEI